MILASSQGLVANLEDLNAHIWRASESDIRDRRQDASARDAPIELGARFAFLVFFELARLSVQHRRVMKLDY